MLNLISFPILQCCRETASWYVYAWTNHLGHKTMWNKTWLYSFAVFWVEKKMLPDRKYWKFAHSDLNHASPLNCTAFFGEKILTKNDMQQHLANPLIPNSHHSRCNNQILKSVLVARWSQLFTVQGRENISDLVQFYSCEKNGKRPSGRELDKEATQTVCGSKCPNTETEGKMNPSCLPERGGKKECGRKEKWQCVHSVAGW